MATEIRIKDFAKRYQDVTAVDGLNLDVGEGELFGLLGPNGAGKSTVIMALCGLVPPTRGTLEVGGHDVIKEPLKVKELIGVCPQETAVFSYLNGFENVETFGNLYGMPKDLLRKRSVELLTKMGLIDDAKRKAGKYSGGMKRRLSLILALINDPKIAFLDEPTVAMDPQSKHAVWDLIRELKQQNKTVMLTTHSMQEAEAFCDRVGIIDYGKLIALGNPTKLVSEEGVANLEELFIKLTGRTIREEM